MAVLGAGLPVRFRAGYECKNYPGGNMYDRYGRALLGLALVVGLVVLFLYNSVG